jgi:hypothetical protein
MAHHYKKIFKEKLHVGTNARWAILISTCQTSKNKIKNFKKYTSPVMVYTLQKYSIIEFEGYKGFAKIINWGKGE